MPTAGSLAGVVASTRFQQLLDEWAPLAEWGVALGTMLLAATTAWLAYEARREGRASAHATTIMGEQVELQRVQMNLATQPLVYPAVTRAWASRVAGSGYDSAGAQLLPLRNGGPGLALNVHGACYITDPTRGTRRSFEIHGGSIAAGEVFDARAESPVVSGWSGVDGFVTYEDISGEEWVTHFRFGQGRTGQLIGFHDPPARVREVGDPRERHRPPS